jgi:hypothetical protein
MQAIGRHKLIHIWMAGTLILLVGSALVLRPDQDWSQYLKHRHVGVYPSDLKARQLVTQVRLLQGDGHAVDQIVERLLSNRPSTSEAVARLADHKAALDAKRRAEERLARFAAIALFPPFLVLELGAALLWLRRGYSLWLGARHARAT